MADAPMLSEEVLRQRLESFETMRRFFFDMWLENPHLAEKAGARIRALLQPLAEVEER